MKIDIHTHTKQCKTGDPATRAIAAKDFCETVQATDVRIIAITNHNHFDIEQYDEIYRLINEGIQVWPGIELDVSHDSVRGHLLVIVSPTMAAKFAESVGALIGGQTADAFLATVEEVANTFECFEPIYVAHYKQKKPDLSDEAINYLIAKAGSPNRVLKEVTNAISAGIFISHGHSSIYGSDVQDWSRYEVMARELPELRLPVDSFEHFRLLLKKDANTINTALSQKTSEELLLLPFDDSSILKFRAYNDITVIFGPKGTGKTRILEAIAAHYSKNGIDVNVYESAADKLHEIFDTKGKELSVNVSSYGIDLCIEEISLLKDCVEVDVTSILKYIAFFETTTTNKNAKKILLQDISAEDEMAPRRKFIDFNKAAEKTLEFIHFLTGDSSISEELTSEELGEIHVVLSGLLGRLKKREWSAFASWKEVQFLNAAIEKVRLEIERKTGNPAKPISTGFRNYALNRIGIERAALKIIGNVETKIPAHSEVIGSLGAKKGNLELQTDLVIQDGRVTDGSFKPLKGVKKIPQKKFVEKVRLIASRAYSEYLFSAVAELNQIEDAEMITSMSELLLCKRFFALNGKPYEPSSGESSMVMLHKELETDKDVYILDEPERSLGNQYISDVVVPLIRQLARANKRVFISTHDANIAVRTLPYCSIYRSYESPKYNTHIGNPFSNDLVNPDDSSDRVDWKKISMTVLEGGEDAFGERRTIYGNH